MRISRVSALPSGNRSGLATDRERVRVLYDGKQTVVGANGPRGCWLYVKDTTRTYV